MGSWVELRHLPAVLLCVCTVGWWLLRSLPVINCHVTCCQSVCHVTCCWMCVHLCVTVSHDETRLLSNKLSIAICATLDVSVTIKLKQLSSTPSSDVLNVLNILVYITVRDQRGVWQMSWIISKRINISLKNRGVECRWGRQKSRFWAYNWLDCLC